MNDVIIEISGKRFYFTEKCDAISFLRTYEEEIIKIDTKKKIVSLSILDDRDGNKLSMYLSSGYSVTYEGKTGYTLEIIDKKDDI